MGEFFRRLLGMERRMLFYKRTISQLEQRLLAAEQQLAQLRGTV